jgi:hypothetical protein
MDLRPSTHYGNTLYKSFTHRCHPFTNYRERRLLSSILRIKKGFLHLHCDTRRIFFVMLAIPPKEGHNTTKYIGAWN